MNRSVETLPSYAGPASGVRTGRDASIIDYRTLRLRLYLVIAIADGLARTYPESRYLSGVTDTKWWEVWKKEEDQFGVQATKQIAERPWWQFW